MNPRIHHPSWYRLVGLFDEEEADIATKTTGTLITPPLSQVQTPRLMIVCQDDRWEIRTSDSNEVSRLQDIASKIFDEILPHTPVTAIGFNFVLRRATEAEDVGGYLATSLTNTPLGLRDTAAVSAELTLRRSFEDRIVVVSIHPAPEDKQSLLVASNYEYRFRGEKIIKLGELIARRYGIDKTDAEEQTALIVEAINSSVGD